MADSNGSLNINTDHLLARLLEVRKSQALSAEEIEFLCEKSKEIFLRQPMLLELKAPMKICGNIRGCYRDLLRIFEFDSWSLKSNYLFLGNYVDEGKQSVETICLLLAYKIKYPDEIFLLRGSHECSSTNRIYGFYDECKRRYNIKLWKTFNDCFNCLPAAAVIDGKIFCCHGGLSPDLQSFEQIRQIQRPTDVPDYGVFHDLLWSDPDETIKRWDENDVSISRRFGAEIVYEFLRQHNLDLICRSHEFVPNGYEFFADHHLVTIFSITNFHEHKDNNGAIMLVDENSKISFTILHPETE